MPLADHPQLLQALEQNNPIVYLCGAGISMALGCHQTGWGAWLESGKRYLSAAEAAEFDQRIGAWTADSMIDAAGYLLDILKRQGNYHPYMQSSFSTLTVKQETMAAAFSQIHRAGDYITTTNYDLLLEQAAGVGTATYSDPAEILKMLHGEKPRRVIHLHGAYDPANGIDDIVADKRQYDDIVGNQGAQFIQNLIGTHPMIILGCGATVDDQNLRGFLAFAEKYLKLDVPYFYIHKAGDDLSHLPGSMIPVCYGDDHRDLPAFLADLAAYRLRHRMILKDIVSIYPYGMARKNTSAFGRLHFSNEFSAFIGRKAEQAQLRGFLNSPKHIAWWAVTGEGGIGKSRLLLEWVRNLPSDWYGFFGNTKADPDRYQSIQPFTNTVVVLDYIVGRESQCAKIIENLMRIFEASPYRLRIILLERQFAANRENWLSKLTADMDGGFKLQFQACTYETGASPGGLVPLHVEALTEADERDYIAEYLRSYLPAFTDPATTKEYLDDLDQKCRDIQNGFYGTLDPKHRRPLFLSIYTELWVYHNGDAAVDSVEKLLEVYLEKEEQRWLLRFGGDRNVLYAYQKLLGLACAVEIICLNTGGLDYLQGDADCLLRFLESEKRAGKKKVSWDELFIWKEPEKRDARYSEDVLRMIAENEDIPENERFGYALSIMKALPDPDADPNRPLEVYTLFKPEYPDIIREFVADYYLDDEEIVPFTKLAREISTYEFGPFLYRALEDFPEEPVYREMLLIPPEEPTDYLEFYTTLLSTESWLQDHKQVEEILLQSEISEPYHFAEVRLWTMLLVILEREARLEELYETAANAIAYFKDRLGSEALLRSFPNILDACIIPFYNRKQADRMEGILKLADALADAAQKQVILANACVHGYRRLLELRLLFDKGRGVSRCWDRITAYASRFPENAEIAAHLAQCGEKWSLDLLEKQLPKRFRGMANHVENAYYRHSTEDIAGSLATILANAYFLACRINKQPNGDPVMQDCFAKLGKLLEKHPGCQEVVCAYATVHADRLFIGPDDACISEKEILQYNTWYTRYGEKIEMAESYAKILALRHHHLRKNGNVKEARKCIREIERVARSMDYSEYGEQENQIQEILDYIRAGLL